MNLRPRDRLALVVVLVAGLAAAYYFLALAPERQKAISLTRSISAQRQALTQAEQQYAAGHAAELEVRANASEASADGLAVPAHANIPSLLRILQRTAGTEHVDMKSIAPAGSSGTSGSTASSTSGSSGDVPVSITFTGTYQNLEQLLDRLDRFVVVSKNKLSATGPLISVSSLSLGGSGSLSAAVSAHIYQSSATSSSSSTAASGGSK